jgi:predicted metal-binding membrane protein
MSTANMSGESGSMNARRRAPVRWPWLVVALAWAVALLATLLHQRYLIDHHWLIEASGLPWLIAALIFLASWQVMTVAMMLPSSMPMVTLMTYAARKQTQKRRVLGAFLAGYAIVWTAFALAAFTGDTLIHRSVDAWPWLAAHSYLIGATTFALAGIFQFTPLKEHCLKACRSPLSFMVRYYRAGIAPAWRLGLRHGMFCLGCCWALMLVMFGVGIGSLGWMAALAGVMTIEKAVPGGRRIGPLVGIAMLMLAALWLAHPTGLLASVES